MPCDRCSGWNPVWYAPNELWNLVVGGPDAMDDPGGMLCPTCFIACAETQGISPTAWVLRRETPADYPGRSITINFEEDVRDETIQKLVDALKGLQEAQRRGPIEAPPEGSGQ